MIESRFLVEEPGDVRMTLKTSAPMREWERLRDELEKLPVSAGGLVLELRSQLTQMLAAARKVHYAEAKS